MANVIYRGSIAQQPLTINLPVGGNYQPGILVTSDGSGLTMATAASDGSKLYVLGNLDFKDQDLDTLYASGDTGVAFDALPGQVYQCRMASATYAKGDALTTAANGRLAAAGTGDVVFGYFDGTAGAVSAGALADVIVANGHTIHA